jgi:hypothetical protein
MEVVRKKEGELYGHTLEFEFGEDFSNVTEVVVVDYLFHWSSCFSCSTTEGVA